MPYSIGAITSSNSGGDTYEVNWRDENYPNWTTAFPEAASVWEYGDLDAPEEAKDAIDAVRGAIRDEPSILLAVKHPATSEWMVYGAERVADPRSYVSFDN